MDNADIVAAFAEKFGVLFRPASPTEIAAANTAGVPESLLAFYREFEPNEMGNGLIQFFPLGQVVAELTDFTPSCYLASHGYFAIARTSYGDAYLVRLARGHDYQRVPVYLFSHERNIARVPASQLEEFGELVATGIPDFLAKAVAGKLATNPFQT